MRSGRRPGETTAGLSRTGHRKAGIEEIGTAPASCLQMLAVCLRAARMSLENNQGLWNRSSMSPKKIPISRRRSDTSDDRLGDMQASPRYKLPRSRTPLVQALSELQTSHARWASKNKTWSVFWGKTLRSSHPALQFLPSTFSPPASTAALLSQQHHLHQLHIPSCSPHRGLLCVTLHPSSSPSERASGLCLRGLRCPRALL